MWAEVSYFRVEGSTAAGFHIKPLVVAPDVSPLFAAAVALAVGDLELEVAGPDEIAIY